MKVGKWFPELGWDAATGTQMSSVTGKQTPGASVDALQPSAQFPSTVPEGPWQTTVAWSY